jgi:CBS domain-containing protein
MTTEVVTVRPDTPLSEFVHLLEDRDISGAPVVDDSGDVVGVASYRDVVRATRRRAEQALDSPGVPDAEVSRAALGGHTVGEVMSPEVRKVSADTPVRDAARYLATRRVHRALVFEGSRLAGVVTAFDLLQSLMEE